MGIELELQRCTAGVCLRKRIAENRLRGGRGSAMWEWCASHCGHIAWTAYASYFSDLLERTFQQDEPRVSVTISGTQYDIDLELMVQVNSVTRYRRLVRRSEVREPQGIRCQ